MQPNKNEFVCKCCYVLVYKDEFYNKQLSNQTTITIMKRLLNHSKGTFPDGTWRFKYNRTFVF